MQIYDTQYWNRKERLKWLLLLLSGTCLLYATRTCVPLLMPVMSKEKRWDKTDSGTILSSFFWGYTLTQVISGYLSDKNGGHKIIWIAAFGWSTTLFFMPQIVHYESENELPIIILSRAVNGAFQGVHFPSSVSLISQRLHEAERASFCSLLISGSALGTLMSGFLGSYLLEAYHWESVFYVFGFLSLVWTGYLLYCCMNLSDSINIIKQAKYNPFSFTKLAREPSFWSCVIGHACQNNCFFVLLSWMPTYFYETFLETKGWIVNIVPWIFLFPCTFLAKMMSEHLIKTGYSVTNTRKIIQTICFMTQALSLLLLVFVTSATCAMICLSFVIGASGFHSSAIFVNPSDLAPKHSGIVFGIMNTIGAIPGFLGVYTAGCILHLTNSWAGVFIFTSLFDIFGCIVYLMFGTGKAII